MTDQDDRAKKILAALLITLAARKALEDLLRASAITTYEQALSAEAKAQGLLAGDVTLQDAGELAWVAARAEFAAQSIAETYNTRLGKTLDNLMTSDPEATTASLLARLQDWWSGRAEAAARFVATTETAEVAARAQSEFYLKNNIDGECTFGGSETCKVCQDIADGNPYTVAEMRGIGIPHPNCMDSWTVTAEDVPTSDQAWLGE